MKRLLPLAFLLSGCWLNPDSVSRPCPYSANPARYTVGEPIEPNAPSCAGGAGVSYSVTPSLPAGLSLDTATGVISGTPIAPSLSTDYAVMATNSGGSATVTVTVNITVKDVPPSDCSYSTNPARYTVGEPIEPNTPSCGGAGVSYSVNPSLPAGLDLDNVTGVISGTPTALSPSAPYIVTATNSGGSATVSLTIEAKFGDAATIVSGFGSTCALVDGGVRCWGLNDRGQLGDGSTNNRLTPVEVSGLTSGVQAIVAGYGYACALVNGGVRCWGLNDCGQLGDGSTDNRLTPVEVFGLTSGVQAIAAGDGYTCALVNGGVRCWGRNDLGQLGDGSGTDSPTPVEVYGHTSGVQAITAGSWSFGYTCALAGGGVRCWGLNDAGQLGDDSTDNRLAPVQVYGLTSGVQAIAAGYGYACALVNGGVRCWGDNDFGQLGDGSTTDAHTPVQVSGLTSSVQAIAVSNGSTCALVNGGVRCWGRNDLGQLGDGSTTNRLTPVQVSGLTSGVQAIAAGDGSTCALVKGGVRCWGRNDSGQLGDGSTTNRVTPVQVAGF